MADNLNLIQAKKNKKDEFYTQFNLVEKELVYYRDYFKDKIVYCNCDDYHKSNFYLYFSTNFEFLGLKELICTCYIENEHGLCLDMKGKDDITIRTLEGNGDFRSEECIEILKTVDVVVTNPPFSLFREYVAQLIEYDKKFLIIGALNGIKYKETFPLIKEGKMWLGVHGNVTTEFIVPNDYDKYSRIDENGIKYAKVNCITWFTNLTHDKLNQPLDLYKKYNEEEYPKYDNFDAIEVSKTVEIPMDYKGIMGVPISFLTKYCVEQFEIVGELNHGCDNEYDLGKPEINGKYLYPRILIKHKIL